MKYLQKSASGFGLLETLIVAMLLGIISLSLRGMIGSQLVATRHIAQLNQWETVRSGILVLLNHPQSCLESFKDVLLSPSEAVTDFPVTLMNSGGTGSQAYLREGQILNNELRVSKIRINAPATGTSNLVLASLNVEVVKIGRFLSSGTQKTDFTIGVTTLNGINVSGCSLQQEPPEIKLLNIKNFGNSGVDIQINDNCCGGWTCDGTWCTHSETLVTNTYTAKGNYLATETHSVLNVKGEERQVLLTMRMWDVTANEEARIRYLESLWRSNSGNSVLGGLQTGPSRGTPVIPGHTYEFIYECTAKEPQAKPSKGSVLSHCDDADLIIYDYFKP